MSELAMRPIGWSPQLCDCQHGSDLGVGQTMHRTPARGTINQRCGVPPTMPPTMNPIITNLPQGAHPTVREPASDGVINRFQDQLFELGGDPRREPTCQSQPAFPRTIDNSIACALIASVNCPISFLAASN